MIWIGPSVRKQDDPFDDRNERRQPPPPADESTDLRETVRQQMLSSIGGWTGALITAIPTAVFIIVNVVASLRVAIYAAVGSAVLLTVYRLARRESVQQAISGLFGVLIAAVIAARTGHARDYFLFGIWTSFVYAVPFTVSVVVRRPLVGVLWEFLDPSPEGREGRPWHRRRPLLVAYTWATLAVTTMFLARGIVQAALYHRDATGWLAFARIAMGYPLFIAAAGFSFWIGQRARRRLADSAGEHGAA
jgi:hypothetical protein